MLQKSPWQLRGDPGDTDLGMQSGGGKCREVHIFTCSDVLVLRFIIFSTRDRHWQPLRELCFGGLVQHALQECHAGGKGLAACLRNGRAMKKNMLTDDADW